MTDLKKLKQYIALADTLIERADKEQLAECARILAMNIAHYETEYGELPLDAILAATNTGIANDQRNELTVKGMETLVGVLGTVMQGFDEEISH
jgi:hypothetical protein